MKPRTCWVQFDQTGRSGPESKSSHWEQCRLHTWSTDYGRHEDGQYPVGVIERRRGPLKSVYVEHIHLTMPPEWKKIREPNNTCQVCNKETHDQYMATEVCWKEARLSFFANAHLICLQERLGRPLVKDDFVVAPINEEVLEKLKGYPL